MTYEITVTPMGDWLWRVNVRVLDGESEVLAGETTVSCETEDEAREYAERVFLPDLRVNFPRQIGTLVLKWEVPQE